MDTGLPGELPPGCGWFFRAADHAHGFFRTAGGDRRLGGDQTKVNQYMAAFLIMQGLMVGVFAALDGLLFYVFFEAMLIPMFLVIGIWGGPQPRLRDDQVFPVHLSGFGVHAGGHHLPVHAGGQLGHSRTGRACRWACSEQTWLFLALFAAFAVKIPMWPVHTWLPDAHVEAPTGWLGDPGRDHAENRRLRFYPFQPAHYAGCGGCAGLAADCPVPDCGGVHRFRGAGAEGHEKAHCLLVHFAHGFCHPGPIHCLCHYSGESAARRARAWVWKGPWCRWSRTALFPAPCSCALASCTTVCTAVRLATMAAWPTPCRGSRFLPCCSSWPTAGLPGTSGFVGEFMVILASFRANFWFAFLRRPDA